MLPTTDKKFEIKNLLIIITIWKKITEVLNSYKNNYWYIQIGYRLRFQIIQLRPYCKI